MSLRKNLKRSYMLGKAQKTKKQRKKGRKFVNDLNKVDKFTKQKGDGKGKARAAASLNRNAVRAGMAVTGAKQAAGGAKAKLKSKGKGVRKALSSAHKAAISRALKGKKRIKRALKR